MNPFDVLGIEARYDLDMKDVERRHRELSVALHPDKYSQGGPSARREAIERASQVNAAWRVVRDPVRRAEALFEIAGIHVGETNEPKPPQEFLMAMMDMREALADARDEKNLATIRALAEDAEAREKAAKEAISQASAQSDKSLLISALPKLGELRFYRRMLEDVSAIEEALLELEVERAATAERAS